MSIARTTPAQKLRGAAIRTRLLVPHPPPRWRPGAARSSAGERARRAALDARTARRGSVTETLTTVPQATLPSGRGPPTGARPDRQAKSRTQPGYSRKPAAGGQRTALHIYSNRARSSAPTPAAAGSSTTLAAPQSTAGVAPRTGRASPSQSTEPSSATTAVAVRTVPSGSSGTSAPASPKLTSLPAGVGRDAPRPTRTTAVAPPLRAARSSTASARSGGRDRLGIRQRSVHARLRTVSLRLAVAASVAEGSNPQWIPPVLAPRMDFPDVPLPLHAVDEPFVGGEDRIGQEVARALQPCSSSSRIPRECREARVHPSGSPGKPGSRASRNALSHGGANAQNFSSILGAM